MAAKALVKPAVLEWARKSAGLTTEAAAQKMRIPVARLEEWERDSGDAPTVPMLRKLAGHYKRPLAVFYLAEPPRDFDAMRDFRRLPAGDPDNPDLPTALRLTVRRVEQQREMALDLSSSDEEFDAARFGSIPEDSEQFGARMREWLDVSYEEQRMWREAYTALNAWIARVEGAGVLVTQVQGHKVTEMRGFSIAHGVLPVVALNSKDATRAKVFTLLHECAHILLRTSALCDLHSGRSGNRYDPLEARCNAIAAAALMPLGDFKADPLVAAAASGNEQWQRETLQAIARRFTTSEEAVVRRLLTIGKTTSAFYDAWRAQWDDVDADTRSTTKDRDIRIPYERLIVRDLGREYVRRVMDARAHNVLTLSEASDYLGVPLKWVDAVEREALRSRAV